MQLTRLGLTTLATLALTACTTTPQLPESAEEVAPEVASAPVEMAIAPMDCATWTDYQAYEAATSGEEIVTYLTLPPGFEGGCVFKAGMSLGSATYILSPEQGFSAFVGPNASPTVSPEEPIPWFDGQDVDFAALDTLVAQGQVLSYFYACSTIGSHEQNCAGFSENSPYLLGEDTSCFQGHCLQGQGFSGDELLALWSGYPGASTGDGRLTEEQVSARNQYQAQSLESLFPALPVIGPDPEEIAFEALGRTTLGEGEEPTEVETLATYDEYLVVILTNLGLADDSIGGFRYRLEFESFDNDQVKLIWVGQQQYCRRSNPPAWTTDLCP